MTSKLPGLEMELVLCLIPLEEGSREGELRFINAPASLIRDGGRRGRRRRVGGRRGGREL